MNSKNSKKTGGLANRIAIGAMVLLIGQFSVRALGVLSLAVLARLLTPADYGIVALGFIAVDMGTKFSELQIANALVRLETIPDKAYDSAFTLSLIRGFVVGGVLFALAEPIAAVMGEPTLEPVLRWLALIPVIEGFRSPRMVDLTRRIDFSREAMIAVSTKALFLVVAIVLALLWRDYWALVAGMIASSLLGLVLAHVVAPYRPRLSFAYWRMFIGFGGWLTLSTIFSFANSKFGAVLVGWRLGAEVLGQYHIGDQLATMATNQLSIPLVRAVYSGLARVGKDPEHLRRAYRRAQVITLGFILPIGIGSALVASELVMVLAGPQWGDAVSVVQIVAPIIAVSMITSGAQALVMVRGDTRAIFLCNLANFLFRIPVFIPALLYGGFMGLLWGRVAAGAFSTFSMLWLVQRGSGEPIWGPFVAARRSFAAAAAMTAATLALAAALPDPGAAFVDNAVALAAKAGLAGAVYAAVHLALWRIEGRPEGFETTALGYAGRAVDALRRRLGRPRRPG